MPIDREKLLADILLWLPVQNILSEIEIMQIAELIIAQIGDYDTKYGEVFCLTLRALAIANLVKGDAAASIKRERVGRVAEIEYYSVDQKSIWDNLLKELKNICPLYGYIAPLSSGMRIFPGKKIKVVNCDCLGDDYYL